MAVKVDKTSAEIIGSVIDDVNIRGYAARHPEAALLYIEAKKRVAEQNPAPTKRRRTSQDVNVLLGAIA